YGDAMTTPELVSVDLAILFPTATPATVFDLTILIGNGGDALVASRGYVVQVVRSPGSGTQPPQGTGYLYLTFEQDTQVPGLGTVQPADVVRYNYVSTNWEMFFDASDLGLGNSNIDALQVFPGGIIVFSLTGPNLQVPTLIGGPAGTLVSGSDLIAFVPTQTGPNTAGSLYFLFDGSDVSLSTADEDIDALYMLEDGTMLLSTSGPASLPGVGNLEAADLFVYFPFTLGASTSGYAVFAFDGSDVGLTTPDENIDAIHFNSEFKTKFSTSGALSAGGAMGANEDIFIYSGAYGTGTSGTIVLDLDLSQVGIPSSANVNGMTRVN
ncbi:MAG: hypothetical protein KDB18_13610, partial [Salinibacterium sp.]|nr:hypothetical protein [Salinibacterium sp.]